MKKKGLYELEWEYHLTFIESSGPDTTLKEK